MKIARITRETWDGPQRRLVAVLPGEGMVLDLQTAERLRLERAGATLTAARRLAEAVFPGSLTAALEGGPLFRHRAEQAIRARDDAAAFDVGEVEWASPIDPPVMLDASAFAQHLVNAHARGNARVPDFFYEAPAYYKMNPLTVLGSDASVPWPAGCKYMDYELEFAVVIASTASDVRPEEALHHVFGLTIMNDFSARDLQAREMKAGFGPAKGKDFGTALGPWITTLDELDLSDLTMVARVNGEEWSRGSTAELTWSVEEIIAYVSRGEVIVPGQVVGSGTVGLGSGLELYRRLAPGDVVELEIEGLGILRNTMAAPGPVAWDPQPKARQETVTSPARS